MKTSAEWIPGADWRQYESAWLEIVEASPYATAFQYPAWVGSLIDYQMVTGDCGLVAFRDGADLIGLAPVFRRGGGMKVSRVLLLGGDYNDLIATPGSEEQVVAGFAGWLGAAGTGAELADLRSLSTEGVIWNFRHALRAKGWKRTEVVHQPYPAITLPGSFQEYESQLGKGLRRDLKQIPRRLQREHPPFAVRLGTALDIEEFYRLHQMRWVDKGMGGVFATETPRELHRRLSRELGDHLRLWIAEAGGKAIGALYGFANGHSVIEYLSGYDPAFSSQSPVKVLRATAIDHAISEGRRWYDFAKGEEDYKLRWMAEDRMTRRVLLGHGPRAAFVSQALALHPHLKAMRRNLKS